MNLYGVKQASAYTSIPRWRVIQLARLLRLRPVLVADGTGTRNYYSLDQVKAMQRAEEGFRDYMALLDSLRE